MKQLLLVLLPLLLVGCAKEPTSYLPDIGSIETSDPSLVTYTTKITKSNSGLTGDDLTEPLVTSFKSFEDEQVTYDVEFGPKAYAHHSFDEFVIKEDSYIKSKSTEYVYSLRIDFYSSSGTNFDVLASNDGSGEPLEAFQSTTPSEFSSDGGKVYEYLVDGSDWYIKMNDSIRKAAFYSITVIFLK